MLFLGFVPVPDAEAGGQGAGCAVGALPVAGAGWPPGWPRARRVRRAGGRPKAYNKPMPTYIMSLIRKIKNFLF